MWSILVAGIVVSLLAGPGLSVAGEPDNPETHEVTATDGRVVSSVQKTPGIQGRYDVRGTDGRRASTAEVSSPSGDRIELRAADGSRRSVLRRSPLRENRWVEFDAKGERIGYWQRSGLTGHWNRYGTDGRRQAVAKGR